MKRFFREVDGDLAVETFLVVRFGTQTIFDELVYFLTIFNEFVDPLSVEGFESIDGVFDLFAPCVFHLIGESRNIGFNFF